VYATITAMLRRWIVCQPIESLNGQDFCSSGEMYSPPIESM
jgi:hypothetical protein